MIIHEQLMTPFHKIMFDMISFFFWDVLATFWSLVFLFPSQTHHPLASVASKGQAFRNSAKAADDSWANRVKKNGSCRGGCQDFFSSEEGQPRIKVKFFL